MSTFPIRPTLALTTGFITLTSLWAVSAIAVQATRADGTSVWDGVYSVAQAERGKSGYESHCSFCHGNELSGGEGPPLSGDAFARQWMEDSVNSLFTKVQTTMPGDAPGSLSANEYIDLVAFLLQANGFPAGAEELKPQSDLLESIRIQGKNGPAPLPNFAMVQVIGCLTRTADDGWLLTDATEPVRSRGGGAPEGALKSLAAKPLGRLAFRLVDVAFHNPKLIEGHKVEAQGILMRQTSENHLNVTSLRTVASGCEK